MNNKYNEIEIEGAIKRLGVNKEFLVKLINKFLKGEMLEKLEKSFKESNIEEAKIVIHSIKGTSANIGLTGLSNLALDMEEKIKEGYLDLEMLETMKNLWNETCNLLNL